MGDFIRVQGLAVPSLIYGTAWKEDHTAQLVEQALAAGFRAIDTANQRKHYVESEVGVALAASKVARSELFVQTKFTYQRGQDQRLPYDPRAPLAAQVRQSFESSVEHLGIAVIDSYLLHGPWSSEGWSREDRETWAAMEALRAEGRARSIGVSNISLAQLKTLCEQEQLAPAFVQNRCYARTGWDRGVRAFCRERGIVYQGFSLLTANQRELSGPLVEAIAKRLDATVPQVVFRFAMASGMVPLTGTSDRAHMDQDLASSRLALTAAEVSALQDLAVAGRA